MTGDGRKVLYGEVVRLAKLVATTDGARAKDATKLRNALARACKDRGNSVDIAKHLGTTRQHVYMIATGEIRITPAIAEKLAEIA